MKIHTFQVTEETGERHVGMFTAHINDEPTYLYSPDEQPLLDRIESMRTHKTDGVRLSALKATPDGNPGVSFSRGEPDTIESFMTRARAKRKEKEAAKEAAKSEE